MEIFDNLDSVLDTAKNVIGTAANAIAEKTVEIKDASKTKYKIYELKSDIKKMYSAIGKLTYAQKTEGADNAEDVSQLCLMIKEKKDKVNKRAFSEICVEEDGKAFKSVFKRGI